MENNCKNCVVLDALESILNSYQGETRKFTVAISQEDEGCSHRMTKQFDCKELATEIKTQSYVGIQFCKSLTKMMINRYSEMEG